MSDNFIKHILVLESLKQSDYDAPKIARQIQSEVERELKRIFKDAPAANSISLLTIQRQIKALKSSGLYEIRSHDKDKGYYNARHALSAADVAILGAAVYQMANLTDEEKKRILHGLKSATDTTGNSIIYSFERQINIEDKTSVKYRPILPKIKEICRAIVEGKKITFSLRQNSIINECQEIIASPYFIISKGNELYLTAMVNGSRKDFKIALMSNIKSQDEFQPENNFPLKRHIDGICEDTPLITLKLTFPESFMENIIERFRHHLIRNPALNVRAEDNAENYFQAVIRINENEKLYCWLRQNCNKVKIDYPNSVRKKLREQFTKAISNL